MSLTPAQDEIEARVKREAVEKCGKNMGPHDYIPIEWKQADSVERVTRFMCRVCFKNIAISVLLNNYPEIKF